MKKIKITHLLCVLCFSLFSMQGFAQLTQFPGTTGPVPSTGTSGSSNFTATVTGAGDLGSGSNLDNVTITNLTHTFDGDLEIRIFAPGNAASLFLSNNRGGSGNNFINTLFQDGGTPIASGSAPFSGTFAPEVGGSFAAVNATGVAADGDWRLEILDLFGGDSGNMNDWSVGLDLLAPPPPTGGGGGACSILCPADITVTTDPFAGSADCNAYVEIDPLEVTGDCDLFTIVNDYNGSNDASDTYPLGETEVCFDIIDNQGQPFQCCFLVTVEDNTPPVFVNCPNDMTINLDAGECAAVLDFSITAFDECTVPQGGAVEITNNNVYSEASMNNGLGCGIGGWQALTAYNLTAVGVPDDVLINSVEWIIWNTVGNPTATVNVYEYSTAIPGGNLNYANMTLLGTGTGTLPPAPGGAGNGTAHSIDLDVPVLVSGGNIVVEVVSGNSVFAAGFIVGSNSNGYSDGNGYYASTACGVPQPTPPASIGFPGLNYMIQLLGEFPAQDPGLPVEADPGNPFASGDAFPIGGPYCLLYTTFDDEGNSATCDFCVTVLEFPNPTGSLTCNDHVNISLDENCESLVSADDILEGGPYGCYDFYEVNLFYDAGLTDPVPTSPLLTGANVGQNLWVQIVDPNSSQGNSCWGTLFVEDKIIPDLECSAYAVDCNDLTTPGYEREVPGGLSSASVEDGGMWASTGMFDNDFPISGAGTVTDVNVSLDISHTWVGDLTISITSPDGTSINVLQNACGAANDIDVTFDDESPNPFQCAGAPILNGDMMPQNALSGFDGETAEGVWVVTVNDPIGGDGGNINNITLEVEFSGIMISVPFPVSDDVTIIGNNQPYTLIGFDPCGPATLTYEDDEVNGDCVNDDFIKQVFRTWTAVDQSGNSTSCTDTITINRSTIDDVEFPTNKDGIEDDYLLCADNFATDDEGHPHPSVTGYPTINGLPILSGGACEFAVDYDDQVLPICEGTYKIIRTWTVLAWCPTTQIATDVQLIKVVDDQGPDLVCPADMVVSTGQSDCTASVILPAPTLSDACSNSNSYSIEVSQGLLVGNTLYGIPLGITTVTYTAEDACGNEAECTFQILVEDEIPPIAICESFHVVGLTINEPTLVPALVFDDGSYDNCDLVEYKVRRMDNPNCPGNDATAFGDYVPFYCCDVGLDASGNPLTVMVELRVRDAAGNTNSCMVEVEVQDKLNPAIQCPPNKVLDCYDDPYDLSVTGVATATDNCSAVVTHIDQGSIDNCGEGTIFRIWTATDPGGRTASCVQTIQVLNSDPFYITDTNCFNQNPNDGVIWPCDYETNTCDPGLTPDITGEPTIIEDGCDLVAVTYEDLELPIQDPACLKILREWYVIDWCTYDPNTGEGFWEYVQIIKVLNSDDPVITSSCDDVAFCSYDPDCEDGEATLVLEATDDCTDDADLNYYYWIDAFSDGTDDIHAEGSDASGTYPIGTHTIRWDVEDGCGNVATCTYQFIVADCKAPTANLLNGIAVDIMENCEIEIWANDWDNPSSPSFDNCGIDYWLVQSPSQGPGQTSPPSTASPSWTFTTSEIGTNTVDVWILDINGNWGYTSTYIIVQDNVPPFCMGPGGFTISGDISTEEDEMVETVTVEIEGNNPGMPDPDVTGVTGEYGFPGLPVGGNYVVTPEKDIDPLNGVSTYDLVLMSKHILQIELLPTPYKIIAADVNKSGSVSAVDMVELRKLILFINTDFPDNTSWRFVDAEFVFPNATNPWETSFPEVFSVNGLTEDEIGNFVAIKIGDLNGSASPNSIAGSSEDRSNGELVFAIDDTEMVAGETYTVDFTAKDFKGILGYQYTFAFDNNVVEFIDVQAGELTNLDDNNFGMTMLNEGIITASWNNSDAVTLDNDAVLFSMTFVAKSNTQLSDAISLNSRYTKAEGYNNNLDKLDIALEFNGSTVVGGDFDLYQNQPNPFKDETVIGFNLPESTFAKLTVYDVSGKVLRVVEGEYTKGYNEISLNQAQLAGTGVLYYQLDTDTNSATKKMILIK